MKIMIDLDSTVADLMTDWLGAINKDWREKAGFEYTLDMVKTWNVGAHHPAGNAVFDYLAKPNLFRNLKPFPHALDVLSKSYLRGDTHYIVTDAVSAAAQQCQAEKLAWINQHMPWVQLPNIYIIHKGDPWDKTSLVAKLKPDIVIEDGPHHIESIAQIEKFMPQILTIGYEYNRHVADYCERSFHLSNTSTISVKLGVLLRNTLFRRHTNDA